MEQPSKPPSESGEPPQKLLKRTREATADIEMSLAIFTRKSSKRIECEKCRRIIEHEEWSLTKILSILKKHVIVFNCQHQIKEFILDGVQLTLLDTAEKKESWNWNDLPTGIKEHVVKRLHPEAREALASTSRTEHKLVTSVQFGTIHKLTLEGNRNGYFIRIQKNEYDLNDRAFDFDCEREEEGFRAKLIELLENVHFIRNLTVRVWRWPSESFRNLLELASSERQFHVSQLYIQFYEAIDVLRQIMPFSLDVINLQSDEDDMNIYDMPHVINAKRFGLQNSFLGIYELMKLKATDIVLKSITELSDKHINIFIKKIINNPDFEHFLFEFTTHHKFTLQGLNHSSFHVCKFDDPELHEFKDERSFSASIPCAAGVLYIQYNYDQRILEGRVIKSVIDLPKVIVTHQFLKIHSLHIDLKTLQLTLKVFECESLLCVRVAIEVNDLDAGSTRLFNSAVEMEQEILNLLEPVTCVKFLKIEYSDWHPESFRFKRNGQLPAKCFELRCSSENNAMSLKLVEQLEVGFLKSVSIFDESAAINGTFNTPQVLNAMQVACSGDFGNKQLEHLNANCLRLYQTRATPEGIRNRLKKWIFETGHTGQQVLDYEFTCRESCEDIFIFVDYDIYHLPVLKEFGIEHDDQLNEAYIVFSKKNGKNFVVTINNLRFRFELIDPGQRWNIQNRNIPYIL